MTQAIPEFKTNNVRTLAELKVWQAGGAQEAILEPALPIIDPHHHLRDTAHGRYLLPELAEDLASGHNIRATVFMDSQTMHRTDGPALLRPVGETEFVMQSLAAAAPNITHWQPCAGIVGTLDLTFGEEVRAGLKAHIAAADRRFRGIRDPLMWDGGDINYGVRRPPPNRITDPRFRAGFAQLAPLGMTFDAWIFHHQIPQLTDLARCFPDTTIILNHIGAPLGVGPYANRREEIFATWRESLAQLSRCPNVVVKLGGLGMLFFGFGFYLRETPPSSAELATAWRPYIDACVGAFGPERCMFESNFPVDAQTCSYVTLWNTFKRIAGGYSAGEKAAIFYGTANRVYNLGLQL